MRPSSNEIGASRRLALCCLLLGLFSAVPAVHAAVNLTQLTGTSDVGDEEDAPYAPVTDNQTVVYIANDESPTTRELYAVRFDAPGAPLKLSGTLAMDAEVTEFEVSQDGQYVVYKVSAGMPPLSATEQLFSARVDGVGTPVMLTPAVAVPPIGAVGMIYRLTQTSDWVVYTVQGFDLMTALPTAQLFSVAITGGSVNTLSAEVDFVSFKLSVDGQRVAFQEGAQGGTLRSVRPDASSAAITVSDAGEQVYVYEITPDSQRIVYAALQADLSTRLVSKTVLGTNSQLLDTLPVPGAGVEPAAILPRITPDSQRVVYSIQGNPGAELKSALISGSGSPATLDDDADFLLLGIVSNDTQRVLYTKSNGQPRPRNRLFSVAAAGGMPIELSNGLSDSSFFIAFPTFDGSRAVFTRSDVGLFGDPEDEVDPDGAAELYSSPIDGNNWTRLDPGLGPDGHILFFFPFFDSSRVLYLADQTANDVFEAFEVGIAGGVVTRLNDALAPGGDVLEAFPTLNSQLVVYRADQDQDDVIDLFVADPAGTPAPLIFLDGFEALPAP